MSDPLPIKFQEHALLTDLEVQASSVTFNSLTMESDRFICVRQKMNDTDYVVTIDLQNNNEIMKRPITADSVIMHPTAKVMALKAQRQLQVFNLELKSKLASHLMNEDVVFWKWIDSNTLGLVTEHKVYHWSIENGEAPKAVFDRHQNMMSCQIINYRSSSDGKWLVLVGIYEKNGRVEGAMQLYSVNRRVSQPIEGHAASFAEIMLEGGKTPTKLFTFAVRSAAGQAKLQVIEVDHAEGNPPFQKKIVEVYFPAEAPNDFPVAMQIGKKYGIVYLVTKMGFIHLYDLETGTCIYMNRISNETIFVTAPHEPTSGIIGVNRKGQVLSVALDEETVVRYIRDSLNNSDLAFKLASRGGLPGADDLCKDRFNEYWARGDYDNAAKIAANSPKGILRTPDMIERFRNVTGTPGALSPILMYFGILLEKDRLNRHETIELAKQVMAQNKKQLLEKWLKEDKLECSEEFGDIVKNYDTTLATSVYLRANVPYKVILCFAEKREYNNIVPYAKKVGYTPDYAKLLQDIARIDPENAKNFADQLVSDENGPLIDPRKVVDVFQSQNLIQPATSFLLDYLKPDREEDGELQTRVLEMNLVHHPQVADAILGEKMFHHYDRTLVGSLCEKAGLYRRALEHYSDIRDIKRIAPQTQLMGAGYEEWLVEYFGTLSVDQTIECLKEMLGTAMRQNLRIVVQIATKYSEQLQPHNLIDLFESFKTNEGLYYYLGSIVNVSEDPLVHFKYIQVSCKTGNIREAERICRDSNFYDAEKVKNFLKEEKLSDQLPLIIVCDRFNFVHDLVLYLYHNNLQNYIEVYLQKVNPARTPEVIGGLMDVGCDEDVIKKLLMSAPGDIPVDKLCEEVEKRSRLKLLLPWLNLRVSEDSKDKDVHNALAKIYIETNNNPEPFLKENEFYEPRVVGNFCEKRDPYLACICYEKGQCDDELIRVTNDNSMFKDQARYLVQRRDLGLWAIVLQENNGHRRKLIDQIVATALPNCTDPEDVSVTVKAFMNADLPEELIKLLEKIVLENGTFHDNVNLQNLLILTAVKADSSRVMNYVTTLENYEVHDVANVCLGDSLFDEAFTIYTKHNLDEEAVNVLIDNMKDLDRAAEYAERCNQPKVWSKLGKAQTDDMRIKEAIDSYIRAKDSSNYRDVTERAQLDGKYEDLIRYLQMARKQSREPFIETELLFAYAKTGRLAELEDFLGAPNSAQIKDVGDRCRDNQLLEAAKILYSNISNHAGLATTLVQLKDYQGAVDCCRKANSTKIWKDVNKVCIQQNEFRLANICGLHIIVHAEELDDLVKLYEANGYFEQLMELLENGLGLERAHMGMFTELAILYTKYAPEKLMEHLKLFVSRINIPKVIRACNEVHLWRELVYLQVHYDEFDNAITTMMDHSTDAWEHSAFKDIIAKVSNVDIYYKALRFYLAEQPLLLNDLLSVMAPRINHSRVVQLFEKSDNLPLIKTYLQNVQKDNNKAVNNALNKLHIEEEDHEALRDSIDQYDNIAAIDLAVALEKHELTEFRRVAAHLFRKNKRWQKSIDLSKQDKQFKDAIETASESGSTEVSESLLRYFIEVGQHQCFSAMLYTCYDLMRPDVVMELAWRNGLNDFAMPYMINSMKEQFSKVELLEKDVKDLKEKTAKQEEQDANAPVAPAIGFGNSPLMLTGGSPGFQSSMSTGMPNY